MPETPELSEVKRAFLEKYLRGEVVQSSGGAHAAALPMREKPKPVVADTRSTLVPIQTAGSRRPLFYFHVHWQGGAFYGFPLARDVGADQPFYVLDPYNFDGLSVLPTLEEMAVDYIRALRAIQPEGPYLLGGFCGGGLIASEVARQLLAEGQAVDFLLLIDPKAGPIEIIRLLSRIIRRVGKLISLSPEKQVDVFLRLRHLSRWVRHAQDEYSQNFSPLSTAEELRKDWMGKFIWAISSYVPRPYPGKMTYFWAREKPADRKVWWGKVTETEGVEFHDIDGSHETCRTEHLHDFARHLKECLFRAQTAASG
ncbi:MAG TPA: thioesterase domain-containing protein [Ktedonobacteraceae bacterium]|nr:thioesterase domain-containing protein [Ktedonobacteraceae bacterium]